PESDPSAPPAAVQEPRPEPPTAEVSESLKQRGLAYLVVHSTAPHAGVYVNTKPRGKVEEKLTVACGSKFVSVGVPSNHGGEPLWVAPGKLTDIPCGGQVEMTMDPRALRTR